MALDSVDGARILRYLRERAVGADRLRLIVPPAEPVLRIHAGVVPGAATDPARAPPAQAEGIAPDEVSLRPVVPAHRLLKEQALAAADVFRVLGRLGLQGAQEGLEALLVELILREAGELEGADLEHLQEVPHLERVDEHLVRPAGRLAVDHPLLPVEWGEDVAVGFGDGNQVADLDRRSGHELLVVGVVERAVRIDAGLDDLVRDDPDGGGLLSGEDGAVQAPSV